MTSQLIPLRTICGLEELPDHCSAGVTHLLSITDPGRPQPAALSAYGDIRTTSLQFHDVIEPGPGIVHPGAAHVEAILRFGDDVRASIGKGASPHVLVHCHMGISRSTAAMAILMAQADAGGDEGELFAALRKARPRAWPNSVIIAHGDAILGRRGRLMLALASHFAHQIEAEPDLIWGMLSDGRAAEVEMGRRRLALRGA